MSCVSQLKQVGVALGSGNYGTASGSFTRGILASSFVFNPPTQTVERVPQVKGKFGINKVTKGPLDYEGTIAFPADPGDATSGSIGDFLASLLGSEVGSIVSAKYLHSFITNDLCTQPFLNLWSDKDDTPRQYTGFRPNSLKLTFNSGEGMIACEVAGMAKSEADLSAQTLVFSDVNLFLPSLITTLKMGGSAVTTFDTVEITITTEQERFRALGNSRDVTNVYRKDLNVAITINGITFGSETERDKYKAVTDTSFELKVEDGATPTANYLHFVFPTGNWTNMEGPNINDSDLLKISGEFMATGDADTWQIDLYNDYASQYSDGVSIT